MEIKKVLNRYKIKRSTFRFKIARARLETRRKILREKRVVNSMEGSGATGTTDGSRMMGRTGRS